MNEAEFSVGQSEQRPKIKNGRRASSKPGSREIDCLQTLVRFFAGQLNLVRRLGTAGSLPPESMHSTSGVGRRWDSRWQPTIGARHFALCPMHDAAGSEHSFAGYLEPEHPASRAHTAKR